MPCAFQVDPDWSRLSTQEGSGSCSRLLRLWLALGSEGVGFGSRCLVYLWLMDLWSQSLFLLPRSLSLSLRSSSPSVFFFSPLPSGCLSMRPSFHRPACSSVCLNICTYTLLYIYIYIFVFIYLSICLFIDLARYSS